jgi:hypothetical protein
MARAAQNGVRLRVSCVVCGQIGLDAAAFGGEPVDYQDKSLVKQADHLVDQVRIWPRPTTSTTATASISKTAVGAAFTVVVDRGSDCPAIARFADAGTSAPPNRSVVLLECGKCVGRIWVQHEPVDASRG